MGRGVNAPHRRSDSQDDFEDVSMDCGFFREKESEDRVSLVLVIRERIHKMTWAMLAPRKGTEFPCIAKRAAKFIDQLGHTRGSQTVPERPPVRESQSNGIIERAAGLVAGQARLLQAALEHRMWTRVPPDARTLCWLVEFAAYLMSRCDIGSDGKTPLQRLHRRKYNTPIMEFGEKILYMPAKPARGGKWERRFRLGVFVGVLNSSWEAVVVTEQGLAIKTRSANREMGR